MRNEATLNALANELERNCGDDLAAARAVGVSLGFVNQWCKDDKEVRDRLTEAAKVGKQGLVSAAIRRAVHGVEEDVYYKGAVVGQKVNYSDGLLTTLLKAQVPEFAKDSEGSQVNVQVNVANLMPRATSYDQWLEMKTQTLTAALPAPSDAAIAAHSLMAPPDDVIEAEYVAVEPVRAFEGIEL